MRTDTYAHTDTESGLATVTRLAALPIFIAGIIGGIATGQFSSITVAEGMGLTIVVTLYTARLWWPLRRFPIAWITTVSVLIMHLLFIFAIPWPNQDSPSKVVLLIFLLDVFGVIVISERLERRTRAGRKSNTAVGS